VAKIALHEAGMLAEDLSLYAEYKLGWSTFTRCVDGLKAVLKTVFIKK
jgi:hypothetical protein